MKTINSKKSFLFLHTGFFLLSLGIYFSLFYLFGGLSSEGKELIKIMLLTISCSLLFVGILSLFFFAKASLIFFTTYVLILGIICFIAGEPGVIVAGILLFALFVILTFILTVFSDDISEKFKISFPLLLIFFAIEVALIVTSVLLYSLCFKS